VALRWRRRNISRLSHAWKSTPAFINCPRSKPPPAGAPRRRRTLNSPSRRGRSSPIAPPARPTSAPASTRAIASTAVTSVQPTIRWAWNETFTVAKALGACLVLFQCSQSFRPTKENVANLRHFFEHAKRGKFHMGWEPRGEWDGELITSLCKELDLIPVLDPFKTEPIPVGKVRYFRLHGVTGPRHRYTARSWPGCGRSAQAGSRPTACSTTSP